MGKEFQSLKGTLLLDGGKLRGSFFHRSVVLICQHDTQGAFGLVLNRRSDNSVGEMIPGSLPEKLQHLPLFLGGPVQPAALSYLHSDAFLVNANVMANLNLGHSMEGLTDLGDSFSTTQKVRVFAGYAGWSAGQLDDEMRLESWVIHPATVDLVFDSDPDELWRGILVKKGWQYRLLAQSPDDLASN